MLKFAYLSMLCEQFEWHAYVLRLQKCTKKKGDKHIPLHVHDSKE